MLCQMNIYYIYIYIQLGCNQCFQSHSLFCEKANALDVCIIFVQVERQMTRRCQFDSTLCFYFTGKGAPIAESHDVHMARVVCPRC